jgi:hypothetical protein
MNQSLRKPIWQLMSNQVLTITLLSAFIGGIDFMRHAGQINN